MKTVKQQVDKGTSYGAPTRIELELARFIVQNTKAVEVVRFVSSGTEAVMSALRLARGYTGRNKIIKFNGCYHGHGDSFLVKAGSGLATFGQASSDGVPESLTALTYSVPLGDYDIIREIFRKDGQNIACIIIEGIPANNGLLIQNSDFMKFLQEICKDNGSLFILDEVITGFRLGLGGACKMYNLAPDIVTYGKIIGGGMPVGAFGGKKEIFKKLAPDGPVYQAGTLSGNPLCMAAGLSTLTKLKKENIYKHLTELADYLKEKWSGLNIPYKLVQAESIFWFHNDSQNPVRSEDISGNFSDEYASLHKFLLDKGIYIAPSSYEVGFLSYPMQKDDIDYFTESISEFKR
jgi:glutamate-1-semialdehyde 2,1-aminomutase